MGASPDASGTVDSSKRTRGFHKDAGMAGSSAVRGARSGEGMRTESVCPAPRNLVRLSHLCSDGLTEGLCDGLRLVDVEPADADLEGRRTFLDDEAQAQASPRRVAEINVVRLVTHGRMCISHMNGTRIW